MLPSSASDGSTADRPTPLTAAATTSVGGELPQQGRRGPPSPSLNSSDAPYGASTLVAIAATGARSSAAGCNSSNSNNNSNNNNMISNDSMYIGPNVNPHVSKRPTTSSDNGAQLATACFFSPLFRSPALRPAEDKAFIVRALCELHLLTEAFICARRDYMRLPQEQSFDRFAIRRQVLDAAVVSLFRNDLLLLHGFTQVHEEMRAQAAVFATCWATEMDAQVEGKNTTQLLRAAIEISRLARLCEVGDRQELAAGTSTPRQQIHTAHYVPRALPLFDRIALGSGHASLPLVALLVLGLHLVLAAPAVLVLLLLTEVSADRVLLSSAAAAATVTGALAVLTSWMLLLAALRRSRALAQAAHRAWRDMVPSAERLSRTSIDYHEHAVERMTALPRQANPLMLSASPRDDGLGASSSTTPGRSGGGGNNEGGGAPSSGHSPHVTLDVHALEHNNSTSMEGRHLGFALPAAFAAHGQAFVPLSHHDAVGGGHQHQSGQLNDASHDAGTAAQEADAAIALEMPHTARSAQAPPENSSPNKLSSSTAAASREATPITIVAGQASLSGETFFDLTAMSEQLVVIGVTNHMKVSYWNQRAVKVTGYSQTDALGGHLLNYVDEKSYESFYRFHERFGSAAMLRANSNTAMASMGAGASGGGGSVKGRQQLVTLTCQGGQQIALVVTCVTLRPLRAAAPQPPHASAGGAARTSAATAASSGTAALNAGASGGEHDPVAAREVLLLVGHVQEDFAKSRYAQAHRILHTQVAIAAETLSARAKKIAKAAAASSSSRSASAGGGGGSSRSTEAFNMLRRALRLQRTYLNVIRTSTHLALPSGITALASAKWEATDASTLLQPTQRRFPALLKVNVHATVPDSLICDVQVINSALQRVISAAGAKCDVTVRVEEAVVAAQEPMLRIAVDCSAMEMEAINFDEVQEELCAIGGVVFPATEEAEAAGAAAAAAAGGGGDYASAATSDAIQLVVLRVPVRFRGIERRDSRASSGNSSLGGSVRSGVASSAAATGTGAHESLTFIAFETVPSQRNLLGGIMWALGHAVIFADSLKSVERAAKRATGRPIDAAIVAMSSPEESHAVVNFLTAKLPELVMALSFDSMAYAKKYEGEAFHTLERPYKRSAVTTFTRRAAIATCERKARAAQLEEQRQLLKTHRTSPWVRGALLGVGTFGKVYEAENRLTGGKMAVKQIAFGPSETIESITDLLNEIAINTTLQHPNIVHYFYCEEGDRCVNLFMELCAGGTLKALMDSRPLSLADVGGVLRGILSALSYLHDNGIIHRDVKPHNILIGAGGVYKLSDFGTATRLQGQHPTETQGTMRYMAPEVFNGEPYSFACDVWSIGVITCEMLNTQPKYLRQNTDNVSLTIFFANLGLHDSIELPSGITGNARAFVAACLTVDQRKRPTASELLLHPFLVEAESTDAHSMVFPPHSSHSSSNNLNQSARSASGTGSDMLVAFHRHQGDARALGMSVDDDLLDFIGEGAHPGDGGGVSGGKGSRKGSGGAESANTNSSKNKMVDFADLPTSPGSFDEGRLERQVREMRDTVRSTAAEPAVRRDSGDA